MLTSLEIAQAKYHDQKQLLRRKTKLNAMLVFIAHSSHSFREISVFYIVVGPEEREERRRNFSSSLSPSFFHHV